MLLINAVESIQRFFSDRRQFPSRKGKSDFDPYPAGPTAHVLEQWSAPASNFLMKRSGATNTRSRTRANSQTILLAFSCSSRYRTIHQHSKTNEIPLVAHSLPSQAPVLPSAIARLHKRLNMSPSSDNGGAPLPEHCKAAVCVVSEILEMLLCPVTHRAFHLIEPGPQLPARPSP